jgi:hypothetical protein
MGLGDDRGAGGKRRCRVTTCYRECEGEVRRAENCHGSDGNIARSEIDAGRLSVGLRRIDPSADIIALADNVGEHPELANGPNEFTLQAHVRQTGFRKDTVHQRLSQGFDILGDSIEERGADLRLGFTESIERFVSEFTGSVEISLCGAPKVWR